MKKEKKMKKRKKEKKNEKNEKMKKMKKWKTRKMKKKRKKWRKMMKKKKMKKIGFTQLLEPPQLQFLDKVDMPVVALTGFVVGTSRKLWKCPSCRSSSRNACPSLYNDRCWFVDPDSADVLFLDKVVLPVVMQDLFSGLDVQNTVDVPQLQFLTVVVAMPVEIPQGTVLGMFRHASVGVDTRGDSTGAVLGQGVHARCCFFRRVPMARQRRKLWRSRSCRSSQSSISLSGRRDRSPWSCLFGRP